MLINAIEQDLQRKAREALSVGMADALAPIGADDLRHPNWLTKQIEVASGRADQLPDWAKKEAGIPVAIKQDQFSTGAVRDTQEGKGVKHDDNKPPIGLISSRAIIEEAKVMGFGCDKYDAHNWRKGMSWQRLVNALLRHTLAYNNGEMYDAETGISHMAHVRCCAGFLLEYESTHPELNDLVKGAAV